MEFKFNNVTERDMDMLFLEEFAVNKKFLRLVTKLVKEEDLSAYEVVSGEISYMDTVLGESDLTIILEKNSCKVGLLIEDKINAIAQPRQYERYLERGNKAVKEKVFNRFYVFLIAPDEYFKSVVGNEYPRRVRYEACQKLFEGKTDARSQLKYRQITKAIEFGHKSYTKIVDEQSTAFWDSYVHYMHIHYPDIDLKSKVREKSKGGDWPTYRTSLDMNTVYIHHKMKMKGVEYSNIDLTFNGLAEHREELKELLQRILGDQYDDSEQWIRFIMLQSGHGLLPKNYELVRAEYERENTMPVWDGEPAYEMMPTAWPFTADTPRQGPGWCAAELTGACWQVPLAILTVTPPFGVVLLSGSATL